MRRLWGALALGSLLAIRVPAVPPQEPSRQPFQVGTIEGRVTFVGTTIPRTAVIENLTDPEFCGTRHSLEDVIISKGTGGIRNVIVALVGPNLASSGMSGGRNLTINNHRCRFEPHIAVLQTGGVIRAVNTDRIFHTTHLYYGPLSKNLALSPGASADQPTNRPGFVIVKCDIHGWMKAFVRVDDHPFHAVSDAQGKFRIENVPEGSYTLEVWHEQFGEQKLPVAVTTGKNTTVSLRYGKQ